MAEKQITVAGLEKERAKLKGAFEDAQKASNKAREAFKVAKDDYVKFNNTYGRVLEVLESSEQE